jgi:hypothetical protein
MPIFFILIASASKQKSSKIFVVHQPWGRDCSDVGSAISQVEIQPLTLGVLPGSHEQSDVIFF